MCGIFDFEASDEDIHMIATKPLIDNRNVMHHIGLLGCTGGKAYRCDVPFYHVLMLSTNYIVIHQLVDFNPSQRLMLSQDLA
jgi:hypothetical protein